MSVLAELEAALRRRQLAAVQQVLARHYADDPNLPWAISVVQWYLGAAAVPIRYREIAGAPGAARERLCALHAMASVGMRRASAPAPGPGQHLAGTEYDCLGDSFAPDSWGLAMTLNQALMRQVRPTRRAAALVTMRNDGITMLEWVELYRRLGFDHIFIFSNDNEDGSDALLEALAAMGRVTLISQQMELTSSPQIRAFEYSLHMLDELRDFEWVFYLDSDEFLILDPPYGHAIHRFLDAVDALGPAIRPTAVRFHWRWYVSGDRLDWSPAPLLSRFTHARTDTRCKSLVRLSDIISMRWVHFPETDRPATAIDAALRVVPIDATALDGTDEGGRLNHYWHKSFPEFLLKKHRGDTVNAPNHRSYHRDLKSFFTWNAAETDANAVLPPPDLLTQLEAALAAIRADPGIAVAELNCRQQFQKLAARYCAPETVEAQYDRVKAEAAGPTD